MAEIDIAYDTAYEKGLYQAITALKDICAKCDDICDLLSEEYCYKECKTDGYVNEDCIRKYIEVQNGR